MSSRTSQQLRNKHFKPKNNASTRELRFANVKEQEYACPITSSSLLQKTVASPTKERKQSRRDKLNQADIDIKKYGLGESKAIPNIHSPNIAYEDETELPKKSSKTKSPLRSQPILIIEQQSSLGNNFNYHSLMAFPQRQIQFSSKKGKKEKMSQKKSHTSFEQGEQIKRTRGRSKKIMNTDKRKSQQTNPISKKINKEVLNQKKCFRNEVEPNIESQNIKEKFANVIFEDLSDIRLGESNELIYQITFRCKTGNRRVEEYLKKYQLEALGKEMDRKLQYDLLKQYLLTHTAQLC